jgi:hypothetical protein
MSKPSHLSGSKIRARQIREPDVSPVIDLLTRGFQVRPRSFWVHLLNYLAERATPPGLPTYGYLLENNGTIVGTILLISSTLPRGDTTTVRCNLSSWYVDPAFRGYGSLLVSKALSHSDVTYVNVTPAPHTWAIVEGQGYSQYSRGVFVAAPALRLGDFAKDVHVFEADATAPTQAEPFEHELLIDHARHGCLSLWCKEGQGTARPFVFRPRIVKGVIACMQLVYCRDVDEFVRFAGPIGRFLACRGRLLVLVDANGPIPGLVGKYLDARKPKYFKGPHRPRLGDLAYTESALFGV